MPICTLLTDFGWRDWYVGALKGTLLRLAPGAIVVDLSHEIEPGDVTAASLLLAGAAATFPPGTVHLAVVDPGVGSARRMLAASSALQSFVAPDNGLLTRFLDTGVVHAVARPDLHLDAPGETFHGRDRFAPIAAAMLAGASLQSLGPRVGDAVRIGPSKPSRDTASGRIEGHVIHVDRYGNLVTDVPSSWIEGAREVTARVGALAVARVATHYAELLAGELALLSGSLGTLEVALREQSAAAATGIERGAEVAIEVRGGSAE